MTTDSEVTIIDIRGIDKVRLAERLAARWSQSSPELTIIEERSLVTDTPTLHIRDYTGRVTTVDLSGDILNPQVFWDYPDNYPGLEIARTVVDGIRHGDPDFESRIISEEMVGLETVIPKIAFSAAADEMRQQPWREQTSQASPDTWLRDVVIASLTSKHTMIKVALGVAALYMLAPLLQKPEKKPGPEALKSPVAIAQATVPTKVADPTVKVRIEVIEELAAGKIDPTLVVAGHEIVPDIYRALARNDGLHLAARYGDAAQYEYTKRHPDRARAAQLDRRADEAVHAYGLTGPTANSIENSVRSTQWFARKRVAAHTRVNGQ